MSASSYVTIWCDAQVVDVTGEHVCGSFVETAKSRSSMARAEAVAQGWAVNIYTPGERSRRDLCPIHRKGKGLR